MGCCHLPYQNLHIKTWIIALQWNPSWDWLKQSNPPATLSQILFNWIWYRLQLVSGHNKSRSVLTQSCHSITICILHAILEAWCKVESIVHILNTPNLYDTFCSVEHMGKVFFATTGLFGRVLSHHYLDTLCKYLNIFRTDNRTWSHNVLGLVLEMIWRQQFALRLQLYYNLFCWWLSDFYWQVLLSSLYC